MTALAHATAGRSSRGHGLLARHLREASVAIAYVILLALLAATHPGFFHGRSGERQSEFFAVCVNAAPVLIAAVGMTMIIIARQIDISIGSQFAVCAILAGLMAQAGWPIPVMAAATVLCGAILGAINGALVAGLGLPSIVVTLATLEIYRESLRWARQGRFVENLPANFQWFGWSQRAGQWVLIATALSIFITFAWGLRWLNAGRAVYAVGSDEEAARLAGIRPRRMIFALFVLMGALTGLASLLNAVRSPDVDPNVGMGWELTVIAAVVVGGAAISGGRGTLPGTLIGVALLSTLGPALGFFNVPSEWEKAIQGAIILLAVASDGAYRRSG